MTKATEPKNTSPWDKALYVSAILSEVANIGIVIEVIAKWWPALLTIGLGIFSHIVYYSDPIIYCFKSLNRLTRIVGRTFFDITFDEEKNGEHPWQTAGDILSLSFYILAIPFFFGSILSGPIGITIGWSFALCGLCVVGFFDYRYQKVKAQEQYEKTAAYFLVLQNSCNDASSPELKAQLITSEREKNNRYEEYQSKRNSYFLYMGLLLGLGCLLICGSAALFAPPTIAPVLFIISKVASGYLGCIALGRFYNWITSNKKEVPQHDNSVSASLDVLAEPDNQQDSTVTSLLRLKPDMKAEPETSNAPVHSHLFIKLKECHNKSFGRAAECGDLNENLVTQAMCG